LAKLANLLAAVIQTRLTTKHLAFQILFANMHFVVQLIINLMVALWLCNRMWHALRAVSLRDAMNITDMDNIAMTNMDNIAMTNMDNIAMTNMDNMAMTNMDNMTNMPNMSMTSIPNMLDTYTVVSD